jgi:hypothetical protein
MFAHHFISLLKRKSRSILSKMKRCRMLKHTFTKSGGRVIANPIYIYKIERKKYPVDKKLIVFISCKGVCSTLTADI